MAAYGSADRGPVRRCAAAHNHISESSDFGQEGTEHRPSQTAFRGPEVCASDAGPRIADARRAIQPRLPPISAEKFREASLTPQFLRAKPAELVVRRCGDPSFVRLRV